MAVPYTPNKRLSAGYVRCTNEKVAVNAQLLAGLPMNILVISRPCRARSTLQATKPGNRGTISGDPGAAIMGPWKVRLATLDTIS